jgi:hypothetical protein
VVSETVEVELACCAIPNFLPEGQPMLIPVIDNETYNIARDVDSCIRARGAESGDIPNTGHQEADDGVCQLR